MAWPASFSTVPERDGAARQSVSDCAPADGMVAAIRPGDFGNAPWQLCGNANQLYGRMEGSDLIRIARDGIAVYDVGRLGGLQQRSCGHV